jgi:Protein of unknown function (DUF1524)
LVPVTGRKWRTAFVLVLATSLLATIVAGLGAPRGQAATTVHRHLSSRYLLSHLSVRAPHWTGYERSKFTLWTSHPDGCNTRYQVLIRDAVRKPHIGAGCYLTGGKWVSPYDGFTTTNPTKIQIDHVVPLAVAWAAGAWKWDSATRKAFANDLGTRYDLLAVSGHANESKGDDGPDQYLPPRRSFDCRYMADYTAILWRWRLSIDQPEKTFLHNHLAACGWPTVAEPKRPVINERSASTPPSSGSGHSCTRTSTGKCIKSGEFCPTADRGKTGYDADGRRLICTGSGEPHWKAD